MADLGGLSHCRTTFVNSEHRFLRVLPVDELIFYAPGKAIKDIFR